jgi:branched-chain amino acid transport system ATP-binding protein
MTSATTPPLEAPAREEVLLEINEVDLWFGGTHALDKVTFDVRNGEIFGIIGPNGAGKSSLLNCINGYYKPQSGGIVFKGEEISRLRPHQIARRGIGRTFQNIELSPDATVLDNVMVGRHLHIHSNPLSEALRLPGARREEKRSRERVMEVLEVLGMERLAREPVSDLPYGLQKRVELARSLATDPDILLLDEPTAGMTGEEREGIAVHLRNVSAQLGLPLVLIEHDTGFIQGLADRVAVLDFGKLIALGSPREVLAEPHVIEAYLGGSVDMVQNLLESMRD